MKKGVQDFWNSETCGTQVARKQKYTKGYFEQIEDYRYSVEPQIFPFAQFTRFHGKKILEVGVGAGTDFIQWVRAGTRAYGIDLTSQGIEHVRKRLEVYGLEADELRIADAEALPFNDNMFDLVYSWGVIHHTPDTLKALDEIIRVTRPGGQCKIMVYNRHSLHAFYLWIRRAMLAGKPWRSLAWCLYHFQESPGTKGFTKKQFQRILKNKPVEDILIKPRLTYADNLENRQSKILRVLGLILANLCGGDRVGWFLTIQCTKRKPSKA